MQEIFTIPEVYIRSMATRGMLGGLCQAARDVVRIMAAFGKEFILIETVGVGQSETAVSEMVDMFLLLLAPGGGDELQGIKRGIMELADLIVVNKADGDMLPAAKRASMEYKTALHLMRPKYENWTAEVQLCSALKGEGLDGVWETVERHREALQGAGELDRLRASQARAWMWTEVREGLFAALKAHPEAARMVPELEAAVSEGRETPTNAARRLLSIVLGVEAPIPD
jgi:LAO/AO transport system kinase